MAKKTLADYESDLQIGADLNRCLERQSGLFYEVSREHVSAVSDRDFLKLELDEARAKADGEIRQKAIREETKMTEGAITAALQLDPAIKDLTRRYLDAKADADAWEALKEGYRQRSFMLRELVAKAVAELYQLGTERGAVSAQRGANAVASARVTETRRRQGEESRARGRDD